MKALKIFLISLNFIALVSIIAIWAIREFIDFEYIDNLPTGKIFYKTKYIYDWPNNVGIVFDDNNLIKTIYGYEPKSTVVSVVDEVRIVKIVNSGAILKTENDSVEIGEKESHHKGYMGIWTECRKLSINKEGRVEELCK